MNHHLRLHPIASFVLRPLAPYHFRLSWWKPSHFPTGLEVHGPAVTWRSFRMGDAAMAVRAEGRPSTIAVTVYGHQRPDPALLATLRERLVWSYGVEEDISAFEAACRRDGRCAGLLDRMRGMRMSCPESVFEIALVALLLQNTTIARTRAMWEAIMAQVGTVLDCDGVLLRCMPTPAEVAAVNPLVWREVCRIGYRAGFLHAYATHFAADRAVGRHPLSRGALISDLLRIHGVGPYTANVIAGSALRDHRAVPLDCWNRRILSQRLFGHERGAPARVAAACRRIAPDHAGLLALYCIEARHLDAPLQPLITPSVPSQHSAR